MQRLAGGESLRVLAQELGVSHECVRQTRRIVSVHDGAAR